MDRDRTDPYGFGRRDERPRGDGGDGGRDLKRPRHGYMFRLVRDDAIDAYLASTAWRVTPSTRIDVSNTQGQHHLGLRRGRRPRARAFRCHRRDGFNTRRALQLPGPREPGPGLLEREEVLAEALRLHREDLPATRAGGVQLAGPGQHGLRVWDRRPCVTGIVRCHRRGGAAVDRELHGAGPGQYFMGLLRLRCRCSCLLHGGGRGPSCSY